MASPAAAGGTTTRPCPTPSGGFPLLTAKHPLRRDQRGTQTPPMMRIDFMRKEISAPLIIGVAEVQVRGGIHHQVKQQAPQVVGHEGGEDAAGACVVAGRVAGRAAVEATAKECEEKQTRRRVRVRVMRMRWSR
jgi:hypothetical protein